MADVIDAENQGKGVFKELAVEHFIKHDLVSMMYLQANEIVIDQNDKIIEYRWGTRAEHEVSKEKIEKFCEDIDKYNADETMEVDEN